MSLRRCMNSPTDSSSAGAFFLWPFSRDTFPSAVWPIAPIGNYALSSCLSKHNDIFVSTPSLRSCVLLMPLLGWRELAHDGMPAKSSLLRKSKREIADPKPYRRRLEEALIAGQRSYRPWYIRHWRSDASKQCNAAENAVQKSPSGEVYCGWEFERVCSGCVEFGVKVAAVSCRMSSLVFSNTSQHRPFIIRDHLSC